MKKSRYEYPVSEDQDRSVMVMANPVSGTLYEWDSAGGVANPLGTQRNVKIFEIAVKCTQTVDPTNIQIHVTIDGKTYTHTFSAPTTGQNYCPYRTAIFADASQGMVATSSTISSSRGQPLYEGREVKIEFEVTGGTVSQLTGQVLWNKF